jgi:phenylacetic acid degradation operon negative regulatory protein
LKVTEKNNKKFIQLTNKGQLKVLLSKAEVSKTEKWDGKWRLIIYDIPEDSKPQRTFFRKLLKKNGFYKLQASVFISPYSLNRQALDYLRASGLIDYIRIIRADDMDYDTDLLKKFNLNHNQK